MQKSKEEAADAAAESDAKLKKVVTQVSCWENKSAPVCYDACDQS